MLINHHQTALCSRVTNCPTIDFQLVTWCVLAEYKLTTLGRFGDITNYYVLVVW